MTDEFSCGCKSDSKENKTPLCQRRNVNKYRRKAAPEMQRRLFISFHHHTHTRTHTHTLQVGCSAGLSLTHSVHYAPENGNVGKKKAERGFRLVRPDSHSRSVQLKFKFTFISKSRKYGFALKKKITPFLLIVH